MKRANLRDPSGIAGPPLRLFRSTGTNKVVLFVGSAHCRSMAKTWVSKNIGKSTKAFVRAMRLMVTPKGRRNNNFSRPR